MISLYRLSMLKENVYKEQNSVEIANLKFSVDPAGSYYKQPPLLKYEKNLLILHRLII